MVVFVICYKRVLVENYSSCSRLVELDILLKLVLQTPHVFCIRLVSGVLINFA